MAGLKPTPRAYLIGGDGFHKIFWPSLAAAFCITHRSFAFVGPLAAIHMFWRQAYDYLLDRLMRGAHGMMWWSLFGLLSSSCCALQLILNLFNFGCAGFNTYLGPLRPCFLAVTITLNARMWELALPNIGLPSTPDYYLPSIIVSTVLAIFLSVLPELTDWKNSRASSSYNTLSSAAASLEVVLSLEGLGCVACTSAVQGAIKALASDRVVSSTVALEEKEARITLQCDEAEARKSVVPEIITQIQSAGFEATLESLHAAKLAKIESTADATSGPLSAVVAGLLSSSCCVLQLGLNLLATLNVVHIGCAGFNKVLGPWRLHLRTLTFAWLTYSWVRSFRATDCCKPKRRSLIFNTVLCLALTFLPELLRLSGGTAIAPPTDGAKLVRLKIDGMGCEACEVHVNSVMARSSGVIGSRADFKAGFAEVEVADNWGFDMAAVVRELKKDGYDATVEDK
jgi:copper chaperone CopZ